MLEHSSPEVSAAAQNKRRQTFRLLSLLMAVGVALLVAGLIESFLRWDESRIRKSDAMDATLFRRDPELGWVLSPGASGNHRHHDFSASYTIGPLGFRHDPAIGQPPKQPFTAVLGDSFTFGLGVADNETFVHHLNNAFDQKHQFLNCGVPGYSTDQELLIAEREVIALKPERILLMVCLANDLIDNLRPVPMQVNQAKPWFELSSDVLVLKGVPIESGFATSALPGDLMVNVFGSDYVTGSMRNRLDWRFILFRKFASVVWPHPDLRPGLAAATLNSQTLFWALVERLREKATRIGSRLEICLLPGKTMVKAPHSPQGSYQVHLRDALLAEAKKRGIRAHHPSMNNHKAAPTPSESSLFFPNDGHFTPEGHRVVADELRLKL
ncbi:MAG: hypothetical protein FJ405_05955 [Verrucomicrobia bacterium]|nr:hypothetical protein [Verrucomicrobiota bacterium]